ncbi:MAG: hypothetical protein L0Y72_23980 [Gemmataceae bacterium]|nr:hypothetical protein [Gemmataceae bacterium]MCI0742105.1 hypothetical protein [Gemmataceae bacterium]
MFRCISILACLALVPQVGGQNKEQKPPFDPWANRPKAMPFVCEVEGTTLHAKGSLNEITPPMKHDMPAQDMRTPTKITWTVDRQKKWFRKETLRQAFIGTPILKWVTDYSVGLYDGENCNIFKPRDKNTSPNWTPSEMQPDLWMREKNEIGLILESTDLPVFLFEGPIVSYDLDRFDPTASKSALSFSGTGSVRDKVCYVWKSVPRYHGAWYQLFYVDPDVGTSIVRWQKYSSDGLDSQIDIEYAKTGNDWFPKRWTTTQFDGQKQGAIKHSTELKVIKFERGVELDKRMFQVPLTQGMIVAKERKRYQVTEQGLERIPHPNDPEPKKQGGWGYLFALISVLIVFTGIWFYRYRTARNA